MTLNLDALETSFDQIPPLPEHYPVVGEVLIFSMGQVTGDAWTADYEAAWTEAFSVVAGAMLDGAQSARAAA